ncbi:MAG: ABC transporter substrate-binding protein, partial [Thermomicrobium sp.]|nr:ABC transporter substrate-binding protein [Thermomicrobium sp.]MDW8006184.1 ABC transporter substrate-binding protein [Thermomicrobium sp.]
MKTTRRRLLGLTLAATGALLASCGGGTASPTPEAATAPAASPTPTAQPAPTPTPAATAAGATTPARSADRRSIKVGLLVQLTGVYAALGEEHVRATQLLLDWRGGTLGGFPIELIVEDEG